MFDNSEFSKSELYSAALQLLRICADWIGEAMHGLETLKDEVESRVREAPWNNPDDRDHGVEADIETESTCLSEILSSMIEENRKRFQVLLNRIDKKEEEVKSLRDGVSQTPPPRGPQRPRGTSIVELAKNCIALQCHGRERGRQKQPVGKA